MNRTLGLIVVVALLAGAPAAAHHSFAAFYFVDQRVTIQGDIVEFQYRNPHAWVHLDVTEADGTVARYAAEWGSPRRLGRQGVQVDTLQPGDTVIITGSPGRTPEERRLLLREIQRPADGWTYASRGRGRLRR